MQCALLTGKRRIQLLRCHSNEHCQLQSSPYDIRCCTPTQIDLTARGLGDWEVLQSQSRYIWTWQVFHHKLDNNVIYDDSLLLECLST
jgi:hypothetical protein